MSIKGKLNRLKGHLGLDQGLEQSLDKQVEPSIGIQNRSGLDKSTEQFGYRNELAQQNKECEKEQFGYRNELAQQNKEREKEQFGYKNELAQQNKKFEKEQFGDENDLVHENLELEIDSKGPLEQSEIPYLEKWQALQSTPFEYEDQYAIVRELSYSLDTFCGRYPYKELIHIVERWNEKRAAHPLSASSFKVEDLFFFDTETTGLGGGTGNTIFLLGYSRVVNGEVKVKQFFLPDPSSEIALYQAFLVDIMNMKRLVTYNGKAFDWPQVKSRHTLIREWLPKLPSFGHFDLLHASRRLWKNSLPSCRLSVVEEHILRVQRVDDTPGYLAPVLYFDYLHTQDPAIIEGVIRHNEWDVCSLISLYIHISRILLEADQSTCSNQELFEVGRWYEAIGELEQAMHIYDQFSTSEGTLALKAKHSLALLCKRKSQLQKARLLWEEISAREEWPEADLELAKLYEHQFQDYEKALHYASKAYQLWKQKASIVRKSSKKELAEWQKRLERLEFKMLQRRGNLTI